MKYGEKHSSNRRTDVIALGLTGGIGAGKSTALSMFRKMGALVVSADQIVHELYEQPSYIEQLVARFGIDIKDEQGGIKRQYLAQKVKNRREELRWLEQLTHPLVKQEISDAIARAAVGKIVVCEVPLLFEAHMEHLFALIINIEAEQIKRATRSAERFDPKVFEEFDALQTSSEQRTAGSDMTFYNNGSFVDMSGFVQEVYKRAEHLLEHQ